MGNELTAEEKDKFDDVQRSFRQLKAHLNDPDYALMFKRGLLLDDLKWLADDVSKMIEVVQLMNVQNDI